jgi:hypothetical protein
VTAIFTSEEKALGRKKNIELAIFGNDKGTNKTTFEESKAIENISKNTDHMLAKKAKVFQIYKLI